MLTTHRATNAPNHDLRIETHQAVTSNPQGLMLRTAQDPRVLLDYTQLLVDPASPSYGIKETGQASDAKRSEASAPGHFSSPCPQGYVGSRSEVPPTRLIASKMNPSSSQPAQHQRRREGGVGTRRLVPRLEPESPPSNSSPSPSICFSSPSSPEGPLASGRRLAREFVSTAPTFRRSGLVD